MDTTIKIEPLTQTAFSNFGDVIETDSVQPKLINQGLCERFNDLAQLNMIDGAPALSIFKSQLVKLPYSLTMVERHPLGSQAFIPMTNDPFLVIVAQDADGSPINIRAFKTNGTQGINYHRNTWHGVLTPLGGSGLFAVVDRVGDGNNLEEFTFNPPLTVSF